MLSKLQVLLAPDGDDGGGTLLGDNQPDGGGDNTQGGSEQEPNNNGEPANNPQQGKGSDQPGWVSGLPEDLRGHDILQGCQKPGDFVKKAIDIQDKLSRAAAVKPKDDAPAEEWDAYRKELGIPTKAEDYNLPETNSKEFADQFRKVALEAGLSNDQAKGVFDNLNKQIQSAADMVKSMNEQARQKSIDDLKKEHGDNYQQVIDNARNTLKKYATEEDFKYIDEAGYGNDPGLINMLNRVHATIGDAAMIPGQQQTGNDQDEWSKRFPNSPKY
jgi:hypothetical protein